jgi:protein transport protein SEC23
VALSVAVGLLESTHSQQSGRVMLFTGGTCTIGPGTIVDTDTAEAIRSHQDLQKEENNARSMSSVVSSVFRKECSKNSLKKIKIFFFFD